MTKANWKAADKSSAVVATPPKEPPKSLSESSGFSDEVLAGLTDQQRDECIARRERIHSKPHRAVISFQTTEGKRKLHVGSIGSRKDAVLQSIRAYDAIGSGSNQFVDDALRRVTKAVRLHGDDEEDGNTLGAALALIAAVEPQNELEATMAVQMVAANEAALMCFERSRTAEFMEHASAYSNMANKAMRSFALHAEAIAKLRRGGEQVVKHVHVNDGGQAVIAGTINQDQGVRRD